MTNNINIGNNYRVGGFYSFKAVNVNTLEERELGDMADKHRNMIVNSGLDALGNASNLCAGCKVGTGNVPIVATQTNLTNTLASTTTVQSSSTGVQSAEPYFTWGRKTFRFAQGAAAGNLTEVGVYSDASGSPLFSGALIVDSAGSPTVLTILADEWLDVTYELRCYPDLTERTFIVSLMEENYTFKTLAANVTSVYVGDPSWFFQNMWYFYSTNVTFFNGAKGTILTEPSGTQSANISNSLAPYVPGSYERTKIMTCGLNECNLSGGIKSGRLVSHKAYWQFEVTPSIPKDAYKTLVLNFTIGWSRL